MEQFLVTLQSADPAWAYLVLFISAFVENVFPPVPGDTVTVLGAYLVGTKTLNFWGVFLTTTAGSILGFMFIYGLAFWVEWKVIEKYQPKWLSRTKIDKVEMWFNEYGYWIILFNRFLSGARSVISVVAGLSKLHIVPVFILAFISCAIWNGGLIYLGSVVGSNWEEIVSFLRLYNRTVIIAIIVVAIFFIVRWFIIKRKSQQKDQGRSQN